MKIKSYGENSELARVVPTYNLRRPKIWSYPLFADIPHAECHTPASWIQEKKIDPHCYDLGISNLASCLDSWGIPMLLSHVHRAYIDVNRSTEDLDPGVVDGLCTFRNNGKAMRGRGLIWTHCQKGVPLFKGKILLAEIENRTAAYWHPYHEAVKSLYQDMKAHFPVGLHLSLHSMAATAVSALDPEIDIVVGDNLRSSSSPYITQSVIRNLEMVGFVVSYNNPFPGDALLSHARPDHGQHALQIEFNRTCFWQDKRMAPSLGFVKTKNAFLRALMQVAEDIRDLGHRPAPACIPSNRLPAPAIEDKKASASGLL